MTVFWFIWVSELVNVYSAAGWYDGTQWLYFADLSVVSTVYWFVMCYQEQYLPLLCHETKKALGVG